MKQAFMNWSGGKDSSFALWKIQQQGKYRVERLLTSVNQSLGRISMHGVREELLDRQSASLGISLEKLYLPESPDMGTYNRLMDEKTGNLKKQGFTTAVFGDIFLEDLRRYREEKLKEKGLEAVFPIWGYDTRQLIRDFIAAGFRSVLVCVDENKLGASFLGREIDSRFLEDLPEGVDPCGENGEYHSFVFDGPVFKYPVAFSKGEQVLKTYPDPSGTGESAFHYLDLIPVETPDPGSPKSSGTNPNVRPY